MEMCVPKVSFGPAEQVFPIISGPTRLTGETGFGSMRTRALRQVTPPAWSNTRRR
jgi:hypothetical protein